MTDFIEFMEDDAGNLNSGSALDMRYHNGFMRSIALLVLITFSAVFYTPSVYATVEELKNVQWQQLSQRDYGQELSESLQQVERDLLTLAKSVEKGEKPEWGETDWQEHLDNVSAIEQDYTSYQLTKIEEIDMERTRKRLQQSHQQKLGKLQPLKAYLSELADTDSSLVNLKRVSKGLAYLSEINPPEKYHGYDNFTPFGPLEAEARLPLFTLEELCEFLQLEGDACSSSPIVTEEDTSASNDLSLTQAIVDQAANLSYDPVTIYNWVYNNIQFVPSYGSIQGADLTLQTKKGNATDIASLLIALLRASDIPARYSYGTVDMDLTSVKNWVGNVEQVKAASNLMAQGGIPSAERTKDGLVSHYSLEHVWVSAYVNNSWVQLDASFKYHHPEEGVDIATELPFDANALAQKIADSAVVNEQDGWVQGVDQQLIRNEISQYQQALQAYITDKYSDSSLNEVMGYRRLIERTSDQLPTKLPVMATHASVQFSSVPEPLRHKFGFTLLDEYGTELLDQEWHTSQVGSKALALSFSPATEADEQALLDLLPDNPQSIDELPDTIPANAFDVKAQLTLDGEVVAQSAAMPIGMELTTRKGYWNIRSNWQQTENPIVNGSYQAIAADLQGASPTFLDELKGRMEATKASLESEQLNGLTKHTVVGDMLQATAWSYMAMTNVQSQLMAQASGMVHYRGPSYGTFETASVLNKFVNTPQSVAFKGLLMDMDSMKSSTECKSNCWQSWVNFNRANGQMLSAYEHMIPEQMFSTEENPVEAISAVKALSVAAQKGQRIYNFTAKNIDLIDSLSIDQGTKEEIKAAVAQGMDATVHEAKVTHAGWEGVGYIIVDPETGAGAYKISGGSDGGQLAPVVATSGIGMLSIDTQNSISTGGRMKSVLNDVASIIVNIINEIDTSRSYVELALKVLLAVIVGLVIHLLILEVLAAFGVASALAGNISLLAGAFSTLVSLVTIMAG